MFRRYPYWGWLLLGLLLWAANGYYYYMHRQNVLPERMAHAVNADLKHKQSVLETLISDRGLVKRMFADELTTSDAKLLNNVPFYIYCYDHNYLKNWNTNSIIDTVADDAGQAPVIVQNIRGVFIQQSPRLPWLGDYKKLVVLFPVRVNYPIENDYLRSHFIASEYIPLSTRIVPAPAMVTTGYPVTIGDSAPILYLSFNTQDIQKWVPDMVFILMLIAAVLASISWIHLMIIHLTRNKSSMTGFIVTFLVVVVLRSFLYIYGIPFNLDTLLFFSPQLYASSKYLSSFGDLFINTLCVLWLVIFIIRHTRYKNFFDKFRSRPLRIAIAVLLIAGLAAYVYLFVNIIRSLVLDSNISFDVSHFYSIDIYTGLGLLVICIITSISCIIIYLFNIQLTAFLKNKWTKYVIITAIGSALLFFTHNYNDGFYWALLGWLLLFNMLFDSEKFALVSDIFEPRMVYWALFICGFSTGILEYFNGMKEKEGRKAFVEQRLSPHRDNLMEYSFDKTVSKIEHDKTLKNFLIKPTPTGRRAINARLDSLYLNNTVSKYDANIYLFGADNGPLYNKDSTNYYSLVDEKNESVSTNSPYLFYNESILDRQNYLSFIPIYSDTINNRLGYVVIDLGLKKQAAETVYPELLMPLGNKANPRENEYDYAIYINSKLITQKGDYPFTTRLKIDSLKDQEPLFIENNGTSELYYRISDKRTIVVVHDQSKVLEIVTVFSYIFCTQVILALIILLYQLYLSYFTGTSSSRVFKLTLRKRVHYSMLSIVFISFIFIAVVTILIFGSRYEDANSEKLQSSMLVAKQSVQDQLKIVNAFGTSTIFDSVAQSNNFRYFITDLANKQKIDINIFDNNGRLLASSQDEIYQKGLISHLMRHDAFHELNDVGKSIVIQSERVAGLSYLSAYEPLRDEHGITLGYLNVPFFSSEKELKFQISNIVVTLINVYAFIFLIASLFSIVITQWITKSFNIIIKQFGRINLQKNERIRWPYDDEIGRLVTEYNVMVNKVEENAARLAQSERERAWREMARQVAHEIKNPLTPMKLNIQFLQQAMRNDNPNIKELTNKVSASIIEQIDNLSYIASEFSNFAKMPEAKPEELDLCALLYKATELYINDAHVKLSIAANTNHVHIYSDHSQLLRVFTNLLENAKQAIPPERPGIINISVNAGTEEVVIAIQDNGNGISEEVAQKIFQPYFTTKSSGTGLGLAMTRKIIEFWKGMIWFESKEGEGTTFFIRLPVLKS